MAENDIQPLSKGNIMLRSQDPPRRNTLSVLVQAWLASSFAASSAFAATITVDDPTGGHVNGACSIVDAVSAINNLTTPAGSSCLRGDGNNDTIVFAPAITTITFVTQGGNSTSALLLRRGVTIDGGAVPNSGIPRVTIQRSQVTGTANFRLIEAHADATLKGLTLSNGSVQGGSTGSGAAVLIRSGNLTIADSMITGNSVSGGGFICSGGGIYADALSVMHSTILDNNVSAAGCQYAYGGGIRGRVVTLASTVVKNNNITGGGVRAVGGGVAAVESLNTTYSTISGNSLSGSGTARGGGIYARNLSLRSTTVSGNTCNASGNAEGGGVFVSPTTANLNCTNTTISGNSAAGAGTSGGGIIVTGNSSGTTFEFCTVTDNSVPSGGTGAGIELTASPPDNLNLQGALIYGDHGGNDIDNNDTGNPTFFFGDHNLVGTVGAAVNLPANTLSCDPMLAPLADNGGVTMTHALLSGSCAVDAGPNAFSASISTDQRGPGYLRKFGVAADIGAYEVQPSDRIFANGFE